MEKDSTIHLLLDCLGRKTQAELACRLEEAGQEEFRQLLQLARQHGVGPLLYSRLKNLFADSEIPPETAEQFRRSYLENAARNTLFYHELSKVLAALKKKNIPVIVLKGAYLAEKIYGDIALRPMQDIDLLLQKNDLTRGKEALISLGYSPYKQIDPEFESTQRHHITQLIKGRLPVELHWNIVSPIHSFNVDIEQLWGRAVEQEIAGGKVLALCPEHLLLHLCLHTSFYHFFKSSLIYLYEIKLIIEKFKDVFQWDALIRQALAWKAEKCVYLTLSMVQDLFRVNLPQDEIIKLKPQEMPRQIFSMTEELLFAKADENFKTPGGLSKLLRAEKLAANLPVVLKKVFPSREEMAAIYALPPGSIRTYMYYPVRIKDLICRYGKGTKGVDSKERNVLGLALHRWKAEELRHWLGQT